MLAVCVCPLKENILTNKGLINLLNFGNDLNDYSVDVCRMKKGPQPVMNERLYGLNLCAISKRNEKLHT